MICTSYFAKIKALPDNIIPITICAKVPEWYKGLQYKQLSPKYDFFTVWKKTQDNDYYIKCFKEQETDELSVEKVIDDLTTLINKKENKDRCLICYEKPSDFCHRHLVQKWLNDNEYKCKEWC